MLQFGAGSELVKHQGVIYYCLVRLHIENKIVLHNQSSFVIYCFLSCTDVDVSASLLVHNPRGFPAGLWEVLWHGWGARGWRDGMG